MEDDFEDLLDNLISNDKPSIEKKAPSLTVTGQPSETKTTTREDIFAADDGDSVKKVATEVPKETKKQSIIKNRLAKVEKEIDWGDDNPADLLPDESARKKQSSSAQDKKGASNDFSIDSLLGGAGTGSEVEFNQQRPPTGERRIETKGSLKPTLMVTDEDETDSVVGRGYQPSLGGGSSRGRRSGKLDVQSISGGGSVKFGAASALESESVLSSKKGAQPNSQPSNFDAMSEILGYGKESKTSNISSWLASDEKPEEATDWMNLAKTRRASVDQPPERPKTASNTSSGSKPPKPTDLRPKTASNEPLFGDEISLDQLLSKSSSSVKKPLSVSDDLSRSGFSTPTPKVVEHSETPSTVPKDTLHVPSRSKNTVNFSRSDRDDVLSLISGQGSGSHHDSKESLLEATKEATTDVSSQNKEAAISSSRTPTSAVSSGRRSQNLASLFGDDNKDISSTQNRTTNAAPELSAAPVPMQSNAPVSSNYNRRSFVQGSETWEQEKQQLIEKYESKLNHLKEMHQDEISRAKEEKDALTNHYKSLIDIMEKDRVQVLARYDRSFQDMELRHQQSLESLRLLQEKNFQEAKTEFEKKVDFIKKQKEMEIESIKSASSHLQSVNVVFEQVESQAKLINEISTNLGNKSSSTLDAREFQVRAKENELKIQEDRLEKQLADTERERRKIQELITKLEMHMRETSSSLENDKFNLIQEQSRLATEKKNLHMTQEEQLRKIADEKSWLERAKQEFEREQKEIRSQLYEERRVLGIERAKLEVSMRSYNEREKQESVKNAQAEAEISGSLRAIANEHGILAKNSAQLKVDRENLEKERNALEQEKKRIEAERRVVDEAKLEMRNNQAQLNSLSSDASKIRDEGLTALSKATSIELEHNHRSQQLKAKLTALRSQEQSLAQERLLLAQEQKNLEAKKGLLVCSKCSGPVNMSSIQTDFSAFSNAKIKDHQGVSTHDYGGAHSNGAGTYPLSMGMEFQSGVRSSMTNDSGFNTPADFTAQFNTIQSVEMLKKMLQIDYDIENLRNSAHSDEQYLAEEEEYIQSLRASSGNDGVNSFMRSPSPMW